MMMNESVQHGYVQDAMPDFQVMKSFIEDDGRGQPQDREIANIREICRENKRDAKLRKRILRDRLSRP